MMAKSPFVIKLFMNFTRDCEGERKTHFHADITEL